MIRPFVAGVVLWLCAVAPADIVRLRAGDVLRGPVTARDGASVTIMHPVFGAMTIAMEHVAAIEAEPAADTVAATPAVPEVTPLAPAAEAPKAGRASGWTGGVDLGLNGASGNSDSLNGRLAITGKRANERHDTSVSLEGAHAAAAGAESVTRGAAAARNDWKFTESRWGLFAQGRLEYDDSQDWTWRLSGFAGPSFQAVRNERTGLKFRVGAGGSREFGGRRRDVQPEMLVGMDVEHRLSARSRLYSTLEAIPDLSDWPDGRLEARAGYEVLLDPESRMNLKLGVVDRYATDPGSAERNDVEYFITLGWSF